MNPLHLTDKTSIVNFERFLTDLHKPVFLTTSRRKDQYFYIFL